jgi:two-component system cell cycle response regulator DivK
VSDHGDRLLDFLPTALRKTNDRKGRIGGFAAGSLRGIRSAIEITRQGKTGRETDGLVQSEMAKRVLIVEDDRYVLDILGSILRFSGYDIVEAKSGGEAIEKAASAKPGLILLDLNLPDMKGLDAARAIRRNQRTAHIPVIACSAYGENEREEALQSGMVDYLRKPFTAQIVKAKVEEFILP